MTITIVILNPQTGNGARVWMTSCPEEMVLRIWGFWKRVSWDWTIKARVGYSAVESWIWTVERCSRVLQISTDRDLKHHKMCRTWGWSPHSIVSIVWLAKTFKNSISLLMSPWTKVKKLINRSYLKQQSLPVFVYVLYYCCDWYPYGYGIQQ